MTEVEVKLMTSVIEVITNHGIPAFFEFINNLNNKEKVTVEDIESVKGELDSRSYFEDNTSE